MIIIVLTMINYPAQTFGISEIFNFYKYSERLQETNLKK